MEEEDTCNAEEEEEKCQSSIKCKIFALVKNFFVQMLNSLSTAATICGYQYWRGRTESERGKEGICNVEYIGNTHDKHPYLLAVYLPQFKHKKATCLFPRARRINYMKYNKILLPLMYCPHNLLEIEK